MDTSTILQLYRQQMRIDIEYPDMEKEVGPHIVRFTRPAPGRSIILHSDLDRTNADRVIKEQIDYFAAKRLPFDWKVFDGDTPEDLKERLVAHGFESDLDDGDPGAILVRELRVEAPRPLSGSSAEIRRLRHREELADVVEVMEKVWGADFSWIPSRLGSHMEIHGYLSVYVGYVQGKPASAGWIYFHPRAEFAGLWGGSTVPEYRGAGLYTALLQARAREALEKGRRFLIVEAGLMSRPIAERQGFSLLTHAESFALPEKNQ
jgi:GNAT superfamily N-acetyltransferase